MALPYFFYEHLSSADKLITLPEESSKHIIQVLRKQIGDEILLTNGNGLVANCKIIDDNRKKAGVEVIDFIEYELPGLKTTIAISPLKNTTRFEWFLEKAAELGISQIVPIICEHTEKTNLKTDRLRNILISAMLQSQQSRLTELKNPISFIEYVKEVSKDAKIFFAHCADDDSKISLQKAIEENSSNERIIFIGPEGDFSSEEIKLASDFGFIPVSLGSTRLRTETAAIVAATYIKQI